MPRRKLRRQQSKGDDDRQIDVVPHGGQLCFCPFVYCRQRILIARIDLLNMRVLVNDLRSVIAEPIELMRDLVEVLPPNNYSNQFFAADPKSIALDRLCRPFRIREWIERQFHFGAWSLELGA